MTRTRAAIFGVAWLWTARLEARQDAPEKATPTKSPLVTGEAPAPTEAASPTETPAPTEAATIGELRQEYDAIRESLFASRARAAAVGDALYSSRLEIRLRYASGRFHSIRRATIRLDGASVFEDAAGAIARDDALRFAGFVAPGRHVLTIRIEAQAKDDERFVTTTEDTVTLDAPARRVLVVRARAEDAGDAAWSWRRKAKGAHKLRLDVVMEAHALPGADRPRPAARGKE